MRQHVGGWLRGLVAVVLAAVVLVPASGRAQHITIDGSLSPAQTLAGPSYNITASLGRQVGGNLFHSFGTFGLTQGESANFSGPGNVTNIIGRVTGGATSSIDGAVNSFITGANLYLINPAGIVFGPQATINVSGAFHASSADYLRLSDGARFQATNPSGSTLSAAAPAAFGFLNAMPGQITINGMQPNPLTFQTVGPRQTFDLVGGPVTIQNNAMVTAPSGTIRVASAAGAGEVPVNPTDTGSLTVGSFGPVSLSGSTLDVSDFSGQTSGGNIFIRAGTLAIASGILDATNYGGGPGGRISLQADASIALSTGARVHAAATAAGRGADILLTTGSGGSISASGGALVDVTSASVSHSAPTGGVGGLVVETGSLTLSSGAIFGSEFKAGTGGAGPIAISANSVVLDGSGATNTNTALTGIRSDTLGAANAADISLNVGSLTIRANGEIVTNTFGAGNAGQLALAVGGALSIDATGALVSTGVGSLASPGATGNAGNMTITAGSLSLAGSAGTPLLASPEAPSSVPFAGLSAQTLSSGNGGSIALGVGAGPFGMSNGAVISASTSGAGQGGSVNVTAQGPLSLSGQGTAITTSALAGASGNGGSVAVSAPQITLQSGAQIASTTAGTGTGGAVTVTTPGTLLVDDTGAAGTAIAASALGTQAGAGGSVGVQAGTLILQNGGQIASTAGGIGRGGDIAANVAGDAILSGAAADGTASGLTASATAGSTGGGGQVSLVAGGALTMTGGAQISSATGGAGNGGTVVVSSGGGMLVSDAGTGIVALASGTASGNAGAVAVAAPQITLQSGAQIASTTAGTGSGGAVTVTTPGTLTLDGNGLSGTQIAASATGPSSGPGGTVNVAAGSLAIGGGAQIASSTAGPGDGGQVTVAVAGTLTLSGPGPQITARSTGSGNAGSISVSALNADFTGGAAIATDAATANGGNIALTVTDFLHLVDSEITTSVHGAAGNGGNIAIDPQFIVLDHSSIIAQAVLGHGGNITIVVDNFFPSADSIVSATSALGISGTVEIVGPRVDLNGSLVVLPSELRNAAAVLRNSCAARGARPRSSLTAAGRGGLPQDPETTVLALYIADRDLAPPGLHAAVAAGKAPADLALTTAQLTLHCS